MKHKLILSIALFGLAGTAEAQTDARDEVMYPAGSFNWQFRHEYPEAARIINGFDYGHAILNEELLKNKPDRSARLAREYKFLTEDLLKRPPRFSIAEEVIDPTYAKLAWRAQQTFHRSHVLHRQIYDVYADKRLNGVQKDALIESLTDQYLTDTNYAFSAQPKSMALMDEQYFSQVFKKTEPRFNGLIWAYHWLQVSLYEPFILETDPVKQRIGVERIVAHFWWLIEKPEERFPKVMPMTSAVAPNFSRDHPRAAAIFDNLHTAHDIVSDVLLSDKVPPALKRDEIYRQIDRLRDSQSDTISWAQWRQMGEMMGGVNYMGGLASEVVAGKHPVQPTAPPVMNHGAVPGHDMNKMSAAVPTDHASHGQSGLRPDVTSVKKSCCSDKCAGCCCCCKCAAGALKKSCKCKGSASVKPEAGDAHGPGHDMSKMAPKNTGSPGPEAGVQVASGHCCNQCCPSCAEAQQAGGLMGEESPKGQCPAGLTPAGHGTHHPATAGSLNSTEGTSQKPKAPGQTKGAKKRAKAPTEHKGHDISNIKSTLR